MFDDLAAQLEQGLAEDAERARAEEERARLGRLAARDRLRALIEAEGRAPVRLELADGTLADLSLGELGKDWVSGELLAESGRRREVILPFVGIASLVLDRAALSRSLVELPDPGPASLALRLGLVYPLRELARRRRLVELATTTARHVGTIDRVGRDHLDLAVHDADAPRRERSVAAYRIIPLEELRLVLVAPA